MVVHGASPPAPGVHVPFDTTVSKDELVEVTPLDEVDVTELEVAAVVLELEAVVVVFELEEEAVAAPLARTIAEIPRRARS